MKPTTTNTGPERKRACCCYSMAKNESTQPQKMSKKKKSASFHSISYRLCNSLLNKNTWAKWKKKYGAERMDRVNCVCVPAAMGSVCAVVRS